ncbi:MAG: L-rhamnose mutarotase [Actinomyces succiniciruminis]|uniref:PF05336 domain protein n=1 Tax=Actinomyces succiniciruminis TaxID=1522002 RepID=A0A1L7R818_9ACTO|nr:L-rhamnose mutarotase [Actinomyces succiniciruminis]MBE6476398.1 L-rhamnose mutarotase [Actinomyces succiniciruminis]MBM6978186.1 L-rhamnose mutarotase [Actinomyces succiniciruminis]CED89931.1 PF05336 domain protein [Actinomyces succiniciruminis]
MTDSPTTDAPTAGATEQAALTELLNTTTARSPHRCCFLLHVRPDRLTEYVEVHQHVWEEMRQALTRCGWRNYSLFLRPEDGLVVGYFESDDVDAAQAAMGDEEVNTRWQTEMAQYFVQPDGGTNEILPQYFYLP